MKWVKFLPLIGLLLFAFIVWSTGLENILNALAKVDALFLLAAFLLTVFLVGFKGLKWRVVLAGSGIEYPLWKAVKVTTIGVFAGFITPGRSGDAIRALYLKRDLGISFGEGFAPVFLDRLLDLATLLLLSLASVIYFSVMLENVFSIPLILLSIVLLLAGLYSLTNKRIMLRLSRPVFRHIVPKQLKESGAKNFHLFYERIGRLRRSKARAAAAVVLTLSIWLGATAIAYAVVLALGIPAGFWFIFFLVPLTILVELIPVSVSGIGTREAFVIVFFSFIGVARELAVAFTLLLLALNYLTYGVLGFYWWLKEPVSLKGSSTGG